MKKIEELFPDFSSELRDLVREAGRTDLAEQIGTLPVVARCSCGQNNCAHFYTATPPSGAYPPGHKSVPLPARSGLIVLDLLNDRVVAIEVLDRPDVKKILDGFLPPSDGSRSH
jgi:hypothetical protein